MEKREQLYSGKAKTLFRTDDPERLVMHFRDDATAFNNVKKAKFAGKGQVNNCFNAFIMAHLEKAGVATQFVEQLSSNDSLVKRLDMIPVECVVRNFAAGSLCKRLDIENGTPIDPPIFEFFYKKDELNDPFINEDHILRFGWATQDEIDFMKAQTLKVNAILTPLFLEADLLLVDFKLEFGRSLDGILLGDEFTPDGSRLWDKETRKILDKDVFRQDLGDLIETYHEVAHRVGVPIG